MNPESSNQYSIHNTHITHHDSDRKRLCTMRSILLFFAYMYTTTGFVTVQRRPFHSVLYNSSKIPSIEQLSSDPFMKQVGYGQQIVSMFDDESNTLVNNESLTEMLVAQLSHSDGIRGFFVSYLTGGAPITTIPTPLENAMQRSDKSELIPLACMNVIMPTAMVTMHTDQDLSNSSKATAKKGIVVAKALMREEKMRENCKAILAAITSEMDDCDPKLVEVSTRMYFNS
jgi:hypothetical protein